MKVENEIERLQDLDARELKDMWREYFSDEPISSPNRKFYIARIAYRLQELTYGGIKKDLKRKLLGQKLPRREFNNSALPPVGTRIVKTYQNVEYCVKVLKDGFDFEDKKYKSLSAIALKITGSRISGNFFFGITPNKVQKDLSNARANNQMRHLYS